MAEGRAIDDSVLVERLRAGDEAAFRTLVEALDPVLRRVAHTYVPSDAVADEVVQETWLGVLNGIDRFEGRSSVRTWVFRILVNRAKTRGERERRTVPFASAFDASREPEVPAVDPGRFEAVDHPLVPVHWAAPPDAWRGSPEARLHAAETRAALTAAFEGLPPAQREVVLLRDVHGWTSVEVCNALDLSETNQRVLLHRGRTRLRQALEELHDEQ
ncbi:MAG: RNA polymerase sigma factor [Microthrixaceae bacterium]|nr:RNA polymerase sigma factor [Microthrixaceae bacterium]